MLFKYSLLCTMAFFAAFHNPPAHRLTRSAKADSALIIVKVADKYLIVPGVRIGQFRLDSSARALPALLGKPFYTDSSMGSALLAWNITRNKIKYHITIFTDHNFDKKADHMQIRKILVSSPLYKTAEGLHTGLPFDTYAKSYKLKIVRTYVHKGRKIDIYQDRASGIAFEIDNQTKTGLAMVVYKPKDSAAPYINMH